MERDIRLDTIKGFLIILVILGHMIGAYGSGMLNSKVYIFIYLFHMPLFALVSGYLSNIKTSNKEFWKSIKRIGIPLIVFQILSFIFVEFNYSRILSMWASIKNSIHLYSIEDFPSAKKNLIYTILGGGNVLNASWLYTPYWTLWYLLSLILWRTMLQYSPRVLLKQPVLYMCLSILVAVFSGIMYNGRVLSIQRTLSFFPFFACGYFMKQNVIPIKNWSNRTSYILICVALLSVMFGIYPIQTELLLKGADHYNLSLVPFKTILLLLSFSLSFSFFNLIKDNIVLSKIGLNSMFFYLYHGMIIRFLLYPILSHFGLPNDFIYICLYTLFVVALIEWMLKIKFFRWFTNPSLPNLCKENFQSVIE